MDWELPRGFKYAGVTGGIKPSGKKDLALIVSDTAAVAAGVYTQNVIRAASIDYNRQITPTDRFRGLIVNSGNANACTGAQGVADNQTMAENLASGLNAESAQMLVLSTGVIGRHLPMPKVSSAIQTAVDALGDSRTHFQAASQAILTTDQGPKTAHARFELGSETVRISAMAKGAGMIGPNMATMLAVMASDVRVPPAEAQSLLKRVADRSFNCISVEGHTSTNDALILICNGAASRNPLTADQLEHFESHLNRLAIELAKQIPADGEGATHLIEIRITGGPSNQAANQIAHSIANSNLVKTAILGGDPNWGRIVSAAGYCGIPLQASELALKVNGFPLFQAGTPVPFAAAEVSQSIKGNFETLIELVVGSGSGTATHWTSDLTVDYVKFNSEYTT